MGMVRKVLAGILALCIIWHAYGATAFLSSYDMPHLLMPQLRSEINLIIPDSIYNASPTLPPSMLRSMEYLAACKVPFRLLYNRAQNTPSRITVRSSRHIENQIAHLVFVTIKSKDQVVDLREIFHSCKFGTNVLTRNNIATSFIQLVSDESAIQGSCSPEFDLNIKAQNLPSNFIILYWSKSRFRLSAADLVRETCGCEDIPPISPILDFFTVISNEKNGMQHLAERIRSEKTNFRGRRLIICPALHHYGSWESQWRRYSQTFSLRMAHRRAEYTFAGLLNAFINAHNITFDAINCLSDGAPWFRQGVISMSTSYICEMPLNDCDQPPLSLSSYRYFSTLSFSKQSQPRQFKLSSLTEPFGNDPVSTLMLLASTICITLIFIMRARNWNVVEALLSVFSGLVGKSLRLSGNPQYQLWYTSWLFLIGFFLMSYTNILQSIVTVPRTHVSDRDFEDLIRQNYAIASPYSQWIKLQSPGEPFFEVARGNFINRKSKTVDMEKRMAERIVDLTVWPNLHSYMKSFSDGQGRVTVVSDADIKEYGKVPQLTGWNLLVGKERFFNIPFWWDFGRVERGSLLAVSLERLKEAGLIPYFVDLYDSKSREHTAAVAHKDFVAAGEFDWVRDSFDGRPRVSLTGGLVSESLVLFMYGILIAMTGFILEITVKVLVRFYLITTLRRYFKLQARYTQKLCRQFISQSLKPIGKYMWNSIRRRWHKYTYAPGD